MLLFVYAGPSAESRNILVCCHITKLALSQAPFDVAAVN